MKVTILLFLFFLSTVFLHAQDSLRYKKSLSIQQGITHTVTKDLYRSPYVYKGLNPYIGLNFGINGRKSIQSIHSEFNFGNIRTSFSPPAPIHLFRIQYSYLRKVLNNDHFSIYVGPQVNGQSWNVNYFPKMQAPRYGQVRSYILAFSLDVAAHMEYKLTSRSRLKLFIAAPVCTIADRPHFLDGSKNETKFGAFNYWNPRVHLAYEYDVSKRVSLSINYKYEYLQYAQPKAIRMLNNSLFIGLKVKF